MTIVRGDTHRKETAHDIVVARIEIRAELFGTFWLVFAGCGSAIFSAKQIVQAEDGRGTYRWVSDSWGWHWLSGSLSSLWLIPLWMITPAFACRLRIEDSGAAQCVMAIQESLCFGSPVAATERFASEMARALDEQKQELHRVLRQPGMSGEEFS